MFHTLIAAIFALVASITPAQAQAQAPAPAKVPVKVQPATPAKPAVQKAAPKPVQKPATKAFAAPHVVSAKTEVEGILWVVTDLPNTAASIPTARSICKAATAYQQANGGFKGVSVRAAGDAGRLSLRMALSQPC